MSDPHLNLSVAVAPLEVVKDVVVGVHVVGVQGEVELPVGHVSVLVGVAACQHRLGEGEALRQRVVVSRVTLSRQKELKISP